MNFFKAEFSLFKLLLVLCLLMAGFKSLHAADYPIDQDLVKKIKAISLSYGEPTTWAILQLSDSHLHGRRVLPARWPVSYIRTQLLDSLLDAELSGMSSDSIEIIEIKSVTGHRSTPTSFSKPLVSRLSRELGVTHVLYVEHTFDSADQVNRIVRVYDVEKNAVVLAYRDTFESLRIAPTDDLHIETIQCIESINALMCDLTMSASVKKVQLLKINAVYIGEESWFEGEAQVRLRGLDSDQGGVLLSSKFIANVSLNYPGVLSTSNIDSGVSVGMSFSYGADSYFYRSAPVKKQHLSR